MDEVIQQPLTIKKSWKIIPLVFFLLTYLSGCTPLNTPREYEIVNPGEEPLHIGDIWNQNDLFEVEIDEITVVDIDSLEDLGFYEIDSSELKEIKEEAIYKSALDVKFSFKNLKYEGYINENGQDVDGIVFEVRATGYDKNGKLTGHIPLSHVPSYAPQLFHSPIGEDYDPVEIEQMSTNNHYTILLEDGMDEARIQFTTYKGSTDYVYEREFICDLVGDVAKDK